MIHSIIKVNLIWLVFATFCQAKDHPQLQSLRDISNFEMSKDTRAIPRPVKQLFSKMCRDGRFRMANPGERFQETDAVINPGGARRRLIFVATDGRHCLLHYELGGYGHAYYIVFFSYDTVRAEYDWGGSSRGVRLEELKSVKTALANDRISLFKGPWENIGW